MRTAKPGMINKEHFKKIKMGHAFIGAELAYDLNLEVGDKINLMSSAFVATPFGGLPKQENFVVEGIFNTGFYEFDQNFVFLNLTDSLSIFDKEKKDINFEIYLKDPMEARGSFQEKLFHNLHAVSLQSNSSESAVL